MDGENSRHVDWLELPNEILYQVAGKLFVSKDSIRFGAVCRSWHVAYTYIRSQRPPKLQLLLLSIHYDPDGQARSLCNLTEKRICDFQLYVPHDLYIAGSCYGWLAIISKYEKVSLINPFMTTNNKIDLPPLTAVKKKDGSVPPPFEFDIPPMVVLSDDPAVNPNYVVMATFGSSQLLVFFKPGDKVWTCLEVGFVANNFIYYRDQFYVVAQNGHIVSYDLNDTSPKKSIFSAVPPRTFMFQNYLVEVSGELWLVTNKDSCSFDMGFDVYKFDFVGFKWIKMNSLQGHVFFLGTNVSISLMVSDFLDCKPDCIYFLLKSCELFGRNQPYHIEVFSVKDGTFETHSTPKSIEIKSSKLEDHSPSASNLICLGKFF